MNVILKNHTPGFTVQNDSLNSNVYGLAVIYVVCCFISSNCFYNNVFRLSVMERSGRNLSHVLMQECNIQNSHTRFYCVHCFISSKMYRLHAICVVCLFVVVGFPPAVLTIMFSLLGDIMSYFTFK